MAHRGCSALTKEGRCYRSEAPASMVVRVNSPSDSEVWVREMSVTHRRCMNMHVSKLGT